MRHFTAFLILAVLGLAVQVQAQTSVPGTVTINLTLPDKNTDGSLIPATGPAALANLKVWISPTTMGAGVPATPTAIVTPAATTVVQTVTLPIGGNAFVKVAPCNNAGVCADPSSEASGPVTAP
jgi:hypothetical protein